MAPKLIELVPDRSLLDTEFDGYKLSLETIPIFKQELQTAVDRVLPNSNQYSFLHAKLFGLHNHLIGETLDGVDLVYFIDKDWHVKKASGDPYEGSLNDVTDVYQIPRSRESQLGDYNVSLKLASEELAVLSDGIARLYILETSRRLEDHAWKCVFSEEVLGSETCFVIQDVVCKTNENNRRELHCLLFGILQEDSRFVSVLHWVTLSEDDNKRWGQTALRQLQAKGGVYYSYLEPTCEAVYIASDSSFKFTVDSENPVVERADQEVSPKRYAWHQTNDDVTIKFKLPTNFIKSNLQVHTTAAEITLRYDGAEVLSGKLQHEVDPALTTWTVKNNLLEVVLVKDEELMWVNLIPGDENGEYLFDDAVVEEVHERLAHLCADSEVTAQTGTTFGTQQVEECDFEENACTVFERLSGTTHEATHRASINSHKILLVARLADSPPAVALRHDVDACLWQPCGSGDDWALRHVGTLNAFGYIQASKQQRKFSECAPDLSYSVICESSRHIFIYRQQKKITSGELRQRSSGRRVGTVAQQQVISLTTDEILGIYSAMSSLFLLTSKCIYILRL